MPCDGHDFEFTFVRIARLDGGQDRDRVLGIPYLNEVGANGRASHRMVLRRRPIGDNDGLSVLIMAGDDASGGFCHGNLSGLTLFQLRVFI